MGALNEHHGLHEYETIEQQINTIIDGAQLGYIYNYPDKRTYEPADHSKDFIGRAWNGYNGPLGVYIHVPWCTPKPPTNEDIELMENQGMTVDGRDHLCSYCNLYTAVRKDGIPDWYAETIEKETDLYSQILNGQNEGTSLYFGGGSPSLLHVSDMERIIDAIEQTIGHVSFDHERAIEVIPDSVDREKLSEMRRLFNRISVGVQSFDSEILRATGRDYPAEWAEDIIRQAVDLGYTDVNGDLIIGLQESTHDSFMEDVHTMIDSGATTITLYQNMIRSGTRAGKLAQSKLLRYPSKDEIYEWTDEADKLLASAGFQRLSLTCWTKNGKGYQQGEQIYERVPILGFGAGARSYGPHGHYAIPYSDDVRFINNAIQRWRRNIDNGEFPDINGVKMTADIKTRADIILGLMSQSGVSKQVFLEHFPAQFTVLSQKGLIKNNNDVVKYTEDGKALSGALSTLFYSDDDMKIEHSKNALRDY